MEVRKGILKNQGIRKDKEFEKYCVPIINAIKEKKGEDIVVIDLREFDHICSFFIICTATSTPHRKAIFENVSYLVKNPVVEDFSEGSSWSVIDTGVVVVHIFEEEARRFYNLEGLWIDAPSERF